MAEQQPFAIVNNYADLVAAIRERVRQLDVTMESIDETAGLASRHTSKLLAPEAPRRFGPVSLGPVLQVLGLKMVLTVDDEQFDRIKHRLAVRTDTNRADYRDADNGLPTNRKRKKSSYFISDSEMGRLLRMRGILATSPKRRSQIARIAARARWASR
jgi:hypothetical protein